MTVPRHTLAELRQTLRRRVPIQDNDTQITYDVLDDAINQALRAVSVEHAWPWLLTTQTITTASGTDSYAVAGDFLATDLINDSSIANNLRFKNRREFYEVYASSNSRPQLYTVLAGNIVLRPVPDGVYTLTHYYFRMEPTISGNTAQPLIPAGYDEGVIEFATWIILRMKQMENRAVPVRQAYADWLKRTADNLVESRETRAPRIRPGLQY